MVSLWNEYGGVVSSSFIEVTLKDGNFPEVYIFNTDIVENIRFKYYKEHRGGPGGTIYPEVTVHIDFSNPQTFKGKKESSISLNLWGKDSDCEIKTDDSIISNQLFTMRSFLYDE